MFRAFIPLFLFFSLQAVANDSIKSVEKEKRWADKAAFVVGNIEFVLLHELAHLVVDDKGVPQLGPPEAIADYIAVNMAVAGDGSDSAKRFLDQALVDAATSFALSWTIASEQERPIAYWDTHALGIQRYYSSMCLLYGSSPKEFNAIAQYLPEQRRAGCGAEYQIARTGYDWLLENYAQRGPVVSSSEPINFDYGPVNSLAQDRLVKEIQSLKLIENTVNKVDALFGLSRPISVKMQRCRSAQASWQPLSRELIICYEMLDVFSRIHAVKQAREDS